MARLSDGDGKALGSDSVLLFNAGVSTQVVDPFQFGETRGGLGRGGDLAGRALLFVLLGDGLWELLDAPDPDDGSEVLESVSTRTAEAQSAFAAWDIEWVPRDETREFAVGTSEISILVSCGTVGGEVERGEVPVRKYVYFEGVSAQGPTSRRDTETS